MGSLTGKFKGASEQQPYTQSQFFSRCIKNRYALDFIWQGNFKAGKKLDLKKSFIIKRDETFVDNFSIPLLQGFYVLIQMITFL